MNELISILLVEDDEVDVMNLKRAFKKHDIRNPLYTAENGMEALALLKAGSPTRLPELPKIILLDINMPKMNGLEFLKEIRKDPELKLLSVFVLTTSNEDSDKFEAYNLNVAGYMLKPVSFDKFSSAISILKEYWNITLFPS